MKIIGILKTALLSMVVACSLWSCSGNNNEKPRYVAVRLSGEEKWSLLDTNSGDILCENEFEEEPSAVCDNMFVVRGKNGYYECYKVDDSKNVVSEGKYTQLGTFGSDGVTFAVKEGKTITIIDKDFDEVKVLSDKITQTANFSDGLAAFCKDGHWGFLDTKGDEVIPARYDGVAQFREGLAYVQQGDKISVINKKGEAIKTFSSTKYSVLSPIYANGYSVVLKGDKVVFIDKEGEESFSNPKLEPSYCYMINDGITVFAKDGEYGLMNTDGEVLVQPKYASIYHASTNRYIACNDNNRYGIIDTEGKTVLAFDYKGIVQCSESADHYFAFDGKTWTLIDEEGKELGKKSFSDVNFAVTPFLHFYSEANQHDDYAGIEDPDAEAVE